MRQVRQVMLRPRGSRPALPKPIQTCSRRTHRVAGTPAVGLLAPAFGQALPSLAGVPAAYSHSENSDTLVDLCRVLVEHDLGDESLWNATGKQPLRFAAAAVKKAIEERCGDLLTRNVNYELSIQDTVGSYGDEELHAGSLILSVDCNGCGFLKMGPALAVLENEEAGLGAAFYHLLRLSLYRWLRLYDHTDAEAYSDNLREWAEQEDEGAREEYEIADVEGALPSFLRGEDRLQTKDYRTLVRRHRRGPHKAWIDCVLRIAALTRVPSCAPRELIDAYWDDSPLPALLICFHDQDAIAAAFDAESQSMLESSHEPTYLHVFSPANPAESQQALRGFSRFFAINLELFTLVEALNQA